MRGRNRTTSLAYSNGERSRLLSSQEQILESVPVGVIDAFTNRISGSTFSVGTVPAGAEVGVTGNDGVFGYQGASPRREWAMNGSRLAGYAVDTGSFTNYLRYTTSLTTGWVAFNITVGPFVTGPDNGLTAVRLTNTSNAATLTYTRGGVGAGTKRFSVWLRRNSGSGDVEIACNTASYTKVAVTSEWRQYFVTSTASVVVGIRLSAGLNQEIDVFGPTVMLNQTSRGFEIFNPTASDLSRTGDSIEFATSMPNVDYGTIVLEACVSRLNVVDASESPYIQLVKYSADLYDQASVSFSWLRDSTSTSVYLIDGMELNEISELFLDNTAPSIVRVAMSWNSNTMSYAVNGGAASSFSTELFSPPLRNSNWVMYGLGSTARYVAAYRKYMDPLSVSALSRRSV